MSMTFKGKEFALTKKDFRMQEFGTQEQSQSKTSQELKTHSHCESTAPNLKLQIWGVFYDGKYL